MVDVKASGLIFVARHSLYLWFDESIRDNIYAPPKHLKINYYSKCVRVYKRVPKCAGGPHLVYKNHGARTQKLVLEILDHELQIYDLKTRQAICLNAWTADLRDLADGSRTVIEIAEELDVDTETVEKGLNELAQAGLMSVNEMDNGEVPRPAPEFTTASGHWPYRWHIKGGDDCDPICGFHFCSRGRCCPVRMPAFCTNDRVDNLADTSGDGQCIGLRRQAQPRPHIPIIRAVLLGRITTLAGMVPETARCCVLHPQLFKSFSGNYSRVFGAFERCADDQGRPGRR